MAAEAFLDAIYGQGREWLLGRALCAKQEADILVLS